MRKIILTLPVFLLMAIVACGPSKAEKAEQEAKEQALKDSIEKAVKDSIENNSPEAIMAKAKDSLNQEYLVMGDYNNVIYCLKENPANSDSKYKLNIYAYDVNEKKMETIKLEKAAPNNYGYYFNALTDYSMIEDRIALIVHDNMRCGSGGALGNTDVIVYNVTKKKFKDIIPGGDGCAGAEFVEKKTKLNVTIGDVSNYETASCEAEFEYTYKDKVIAF